MLFPLTFWTISQLHWENTSSESSNNSSGLVPIASLTLSLFHNDPYIKVMQAYDAINPPQVTILPPTVVPPSPVLSLPPMFDSRDFFPPEDILPPKDTKTPVESPIPISLSSLHAVATASAQNDNGSLEAESIVRAASTRVRFRLSTTPLLGCLEEWMFDVNAFLL
ncbi:hypothetical protein Tco_1467476 [Tanacetum coccineum]